MLNFKILTLFVVILLISGVNNGLVFATICDDRTMEPDFHVHGFAFSPYEDNQGPGDDISVGQIRERLEIISPYTGWIRTYGATHGLEEIPAEAHRLRLNIAMGSWVRHEETREMEIANLVEKAEAGYVDIAVVGNEELYAYEEGNLEAIDPCELVGILRDVRQRLNDANQPNIPITTPEPWYVLFSRNPDNSFKYQGILDEIDVFLISIYPFHQETHIDRALENLIELYSDVLDDANEAGPGKQVIIVETGWPSKGEDKGQAEPSEENAARYFYEVTSWADQENVDLFYFSAFDEEWKSPPELEAHWGVWDAEGTIKSAFLADQIFCETFDPPMNPFCTRKREQDAPDPNVQSPDANSDGQFLRLLYDGYFSHFSAATFDSIGRRPFCRIVIEFDFRMYGYGSNADGFAFYLLPTAQEGTQGCSHHTHENFYAEFALLEETLGVGLSVYNGDKIWIGWDGKHYHAAGGITSPIDLDDGNFHHARIELFCSDNNTALMTLALTPNIYDPNHDEPVNVVQNLTIGDPEHPFVPYESRVEFAGRNGGLDLNADIDNIYVSHKFHVCNYVLFGDLNEDCRINFIDVALLAENWLIDCDLMPYEPACVPK